MSSPTPEQMNCGRCLYGPPALCTCGTCPKEYFDRWMPGDGWPEEWIADGPPENIHILVADKPHMRVCFMTSDGPTEERAAMIAQTPSLHAALKEMVNAWEPDEGGSDHAIWEWAKDILSQCKPSLRSVMAKDNRIAPGWAEYHQQMGERHADLGRLMEVCGVHNDGVSAPAVLFQRCLDAIAKLKS